MEKYNELYRPHAQKAYLLLSRKPIVVLTFLLTTLFLVAWYRPTNPQFHDVPVADRRTDFDGGWVYSRDHNNLLMNDTQCSVAFPGLFDEIDRAVSTRTGNRIQVAELDAIVPKNGYVRAMIYDQELYIIAKQGRIYSRELATLHGLHRAIITSPQPLPNIEFAFNTDDIIFDAVPLWGYARRAEHAHIWLMPDFGYWSWPETKVGTMREVQMKATSKEQSSTNKNVDNLQQSWHKKIPKLLWRGATMGLPLRDRLLDITRNKAWADVVALDWHNKESMQHDLKSMPSHCDYKYLMHTEGNSYSGRLKYLQSCRSVIIAHKMDWIQHHYHLMKSSGPQQNYIEIDREFSLLEDTMEYLRTNDQIAMDIAERNVRTFRERYLTSAAEVCYWRKLIRGWAGVSFEPEFYKVDINGTGVREWRGLPFESFALERRLEWDPY